MLQSFIRASVRASESWRFLIDRIEKPMTGALLTVSLATVGFPYLPAYSSEASPSVSQAQNSAPATQTNSQASSGTMEDGVYLYAHSTDPDQNGSEYLVFEVNQGQVVGGFYMPSSSFDCFYGNLQENQLALNVVDSYEQTLHPYSIALAPSDPVAMAGGETIAPMSLQGYHRLQNLSEVDQHVLSTCKADYERRN